LEPNTIFPTWTKVEKQKSGSKPLWYQFSAFQNERTPFKMKGAKIIKKGLEFDSVEKQGSGSKRLRYQLDPFQNERGQNDFKRVWNLTQFFQHGPKWKSMVQVPNPFGTSLAPFKMKGAEMILKEFRT